MGCEIKERQIMGRRYVVVQMPPTISIPIQAKLVQILSVAAVPLFGELKAASEDDAMSTGMRAMATGLTGIGEAISRHLPPDEFLAFVQRLVDPEYVSAGEGDGIGPIIFDAEFMGDDMVRLYPLIGFVLEVNYAQFFRASGFDKLVALAKGKFQSVVSSQSAPTSTQGSLGS